MDPAETIKQAHNAIASARRALQHGQAIDEHVEHATELLNAYAEWRNRGGFEPVNGDAKARELWAMLDDLRDR